jgi:pyruvate formate lyase activating enzyme
MLKKEAQFYQQLKDRKVLCQLCAHFCEIGEGESGFCRTRVNDSGKLYSLNYGKISAINIDPIEKKPLFHFLPGSNTFSVGGFSCNFACKNCLNYSISQADLEDISSFRTFTEEEIVNGALENFCPSVSYTYNEPTISAEFYLETMKLAREKGLKNVFVSNGYMSKNFLKEALPYLDAINIDLKSFKESFYQEICKAHLAPVLENIKKIKKEKVHLEITTLIIPGLNDQVGDIKEMASFIGQDTPWHLSAFSPEISWKLKDAKATSSEDIDRVYNTAKEMGVKFVYSGNVRSSEKENTYCPKCQNLNIERNLYKVNCFNKGNKCYNCEENLNLID